MKLDGNSFIHKLLRTAVIRKLLHAAGFVGPDSHDVSRHEAFCRQRSRKSITLSFLLHAAVILASFVSLQRGCLREVPAGVPMGAGDQLPKGQTQISVPQVTRHRRIVRQSPISIKQMMEEEDYATEARVAQAFSDNVGVPGGVGSGAAAAGSPRGTALGGTLYFYRIKHGGPSWNSNAPGVRPLMQEVLKAGVVKKVSGWTNAITLSELPKHKDQYMPAMIYITGTGEIKASDQEIKNLRDYLNAGGMLFADHSGGGWHDHFVNFMKRVFPDRQLKIIEFDHEIYRGRSVPYAMIRGCPIYRQHKGTGHAQGIWVGRKIAVFYSRGDLGAGWQAGGLDRIRRREVDNAFRMGVNIISYALMYYKYTGE